MRYFITASVVMLALGLAACGQSERPGAAGLVPRDAIVYGEVTLDPEGDEEQAVRDIAARFPGGEDLPAQIAKGLNETFKDDGVDYTKDVEPVLGEKAVFFVSDIEGEDDAEGAAIFEVEDEDAARELLEKGDEKVEKRSYEGTEILTNDNGDVEGAVLEGSVVVGTPKAVEATIDTSGGGDSIEDSDQASDSLESFDDPLVAVYLDGEQLVDSLGPAAAAAGPFVKLLAEPYALGVSVESDAVVVDSTIPPAVSNLVFPFLFGSGGGGLEELPGDAWAAGGQPEVGESLGRLLELAEQSEGFDADVEGQVKAATGLDLDEDLLAWMGDLTFFVRGAAADQLGGGVAIETSDPDASRRALEAFERLATRQASPSETVGPLTVDGADDGFTLRSPDVPEPLHAALGGERVVLAYGDAAAEDLLDPSETLAENEDFTGAAERLGEGFTASSYIDVPTALALVESTGATSDPDYEQARPYLEPFARVVAGAKEDGDSLVSRTRIELR